MLARSSMTRMLQTSRALSATMLDLLVGSVLGVLVSVAAALFVAGTRFFSQQQLFWQGFHFNIGGLDVYPAIFVTLGLAALGVAVIRKVFALDRWHGPADTIYAAHSTQVEIDVKRGIGSTLAAFVSAAGGASVGQYGPLVHFGATLGTGIRRLLRGKLQSDVVISCGVAAAISAGFDAPLAGILFAHEAIIRHFSFRALGSIATSSVAASAMTNYVFAPPRMMPMALPEIDQLHLLLLPLLASGIWFGMVAVLFMNTLRSLTAYGQSNGAGWEKNVLRALLITGVIGAVLPQVTGLGAGTILNIVAGQFDITLLLAILAGKILASCVSLGLGFFGGVFSPALVMGAAAGGVSAYVFAQLGLPGLAPAMVLAGMAAVAASIVGAPIATVLIILELTGSYDFALAALVAVVCSVLTSNILFGHSFFDRQLLGRGIDIATGRWRLNAQEVQVSSFLHQNYIVLKASHTVAEAIAMLQRGNQTEAYCVAPLGGFRGKVHLLDLIAASGEARVGRFALRNTIKLWHDDTLLTAIDVARQFVGESIPVIDRASGALTGVLRESDIFDAYAKVERNIHELENK